MGDDSALPKRLPFKRQVATGRDSAAAASDATTLITAAQRRQNGRAHSAKKTGNKHTHPLHIQHFFFSRDFSCDFFDQADSPEEVQPAPFSHRSLWLSFTGGSSTERRPLLEKCFFRSRLFAGLYIYPLVPRLFLVCGQRRQTSNDVWITWFHS